MLLWSEFLWHMLIDLLLSLFRVSASCWFNFLLHLVFRYISFQLLMLFWFISLVAGLIYYVPLKFIESMVYCSNWDVYLLRSTLNVSAPVLYISIVWFVNFEVKVQLSLFKYVFWLVGIHLFLHYLNSFVQVESYPWIVTELKLPSTFLQLWGGIFLGNSWSCQKNSLGWK